MPRTKDRLTVDVEAGKVWNHRGKEVGNITSDGYWEVRWEGRRIKRYHLIWFKAKGYWAKPGTIDHINRVRDDDRIANLRILDTAGQAVNRGSAWKPSGLAPGVSHDRDKYVAQFTFRGQRYRKRFKTEEEAAAWYTYIRENVAGV